MRAVVASLRRKSGEPTGSPLLRPDDLKDPAGLAGKLETGREALSRRVWGRFSEEGKERLRGSGSLPIAPSTQKAVLTGELNRQLEAGDLHNPQEFTGIGLSAEVKSLLDQKLRAGGLVYRNRLLLEDAYPDEIARRARRFAVLNVLLAEYATLPIGPKAAEALDTELETNLVAGMHDPLDPLVKRYISDVLSLPVARVPWGGEIGKERASRWQDDAIEALQQFWYVFIRRLRSMRSRGEILEVTAGSFIHYWVRYALDRRGWSPTRILNETVDEYHHREAEEEDLRDALSRYCGFLARDLSRRRLVREEDCRPLAGVVEELLAGIVNGELLPVAAMPAEPGTHEGSEDADASSVHVSTPEYIDASFRESAELLLRGEPRPSSVELPSGGLRTEMKSAKAKVFDEGRFNAQKRILSEACAKLANAATTRDSRTALRHLLAFLFLPYYLREQDFSDESEIAGSSAQRSKLYWAELLTSEMSRGMGLRPQVQKDIIDLVRGRERYHNMMAQFSIYNWLQCLGEAHRSLGREPSLGCGVLNDFWLCSSGQVGKLPARGGFDSREVKGPPPPRLGYYGGGDPLDGLVLCWAEGPAKDAEEARP